MYATTARPLTQDGEKIPADLVRKALDLCVRSARLILKEDHLVDGATAWGRFNAAMSREVILREQLRLERVRHSELPETLYGELALYLDRIQSLGALEAKRLSQEIGTALRDLLPLTVLRGGPEKTGQAPGDRLGMVLEGEGLETLAKTGRLDPVGPAAGPDDVLVVLGGINKERGLAAAQYVASHPRLRRIVLTGAPWTYARKRGVPEKELLMTEARQMYEILRDHVPAERFARLDVHLDEKPIVTETQAMTVREAIEERGWSGGKTILLTNFGHLFRSKRVFLRAGLETSGTTVEEQLASRSGHHALRLRKKFRKDLLEAVSRDPIKHYTRVSDVILAILSETAWGRRKVIDMASKRRSAQKPALPDERPIGTKTT